MHIVDVHVRESTLFAKSEHVCCYALHLHEKAGLFGLQCSKLLVYLVNLYRLCVCVCQICRNRLVFIIQLSF